LKRLTRLFIFPLFSLSLLILSGGEAVWGGTGYRQSGAKFLTLGGGGRAMAMAESYVTENSDPFTVFYNPAALAGQGPFRLGLAHNSYFQDAHGEYVAMSIPSGRWGFGVGLQFFAVNDIPYRTGPTTLPLSEFDAGDALIQVAGAYRVNDRVSVGLAAKGIFEKIDSEVANGVAFDLGGLYQLNDRIAFGAAFNHLGPEISYADKSDKLPSTFRLGGGYSTADWTVRGELVSPNNESGKFHVGAEYVFVLPAEGAPTILANAFIAPRAGYAFGYDTRSWSVGFGIGVGRVAVDYAFVPFDDDLGDTHRFGLVFTLQ